MDDQQPSTTAPLFTGDDYQLVADASYREEDRRELFERVHGMPAPPDDHLDRLADLAGRIAVYMRQRGVGDDERLARHTTDS